MLANSAIVGKNCFIHYCHKMKTLIALRTHRSNCPFCMQKNPDYVKNNMAYAVINMETGSTVMVFADMDKATKYVQERPFENLALSDTGYVQ